MAVLGGQVDELKIKKKRAETFSAKVESAPFSGGPFLLYSLGVTCITRKELEEVARYCQIWE
jgi:hypothetical protein